MTRDYVDAIVATVTVAVLALVSAYAWLTFAGWR